METVIRKSKRARIAILAVALTASAATANTSADTSSLWRGLRQPITTTLPILDRIQSVDERSTIFGYSISISQNKQSLRESIDRIMIDSAGVLGGSELASLKARVNELREKIVILRAEQTRLSGRLPGAVSERPWYQPRIFGRTRAEIEQRIRDIDTEVVHHRVSIGEIRQAMIANLQSSNVLGNKDNINRQVDALLFTVTGDSDIQLISAFENLKTLTVSLEELIAKSPTDAARKTYFGQYALLVRALIAFHQDYVSKVGLWDARLENVKRNASRTIGDARKIHQGLSRNNSETARRQVQQIEANLKLNQRVIDLAGRYQVFLKQSEARVKRGLANLYLRYDVAENTYNTFQNIVSAGAIIQEIRETAMSTLMLELPEMALAVDSNELEEIENLNVQLMK